ncbi:MAG: molybdate ABC transporter permease subunit [Planctomycetaceae bacterium]
MDWPAAQVTFQLAFATTLGLALLGIPLAAWLATTRTRWRWCIESLIMLPMLVPPTVLGFFLLWGLGPRGPVGRLTESSFHWTLPFTFPGILLASLIYNLPYAIRPLTAVFESVDRRLLEAAWCLGLSPLQTFFTVSLPLAARGIVASLVLVFAHTVGEFGVILMVGGNIPGVTRTLSMSVYDQVQGLDYRAAAVTSAGLVGIALASLAVIQLLAPPRTDR